MKTALQYFRNIIQEVKNHIGDTNVYLYGSSLRDIILNRTPPVFKIFIESKNIPESLSKKLNSFKGFEFNNGRRINLDDCDYTIDCLYIQLDDIIKGNDNVVYTQSSEKDLSKRVLRFSKSSKSSIEENPYLMLDIVLLVDGIGFYLDSNTINFIFNSKKYLHNIEKRKIFGFLKEAIKSKKPRKLVSNLNTLAISQELFNIKMVESSIINHLRETDFYEFITMIFSNIDNSELESFLIDKCGFLFRDTPPILRLVEAIDSITGEDEMAARVFLGKIDKKRITNTCRLLKALDFKELSKNIKRQKNATVSSRSLCITEEVIMRAFGITDENEIQSMLNKAVEKIIAEPEYNNQAKLLVYLNRERSELWQEEENHS